MKRLTIALIVIAGLLTSIVTSTHAAEVFADRAYRAVWDRTDAAVATGSSTRSWLWGPQPNSAGLSETYQQSPNGRRLV